MKKVKNIFFITKEEAKKIVEPDGSSFVDYQAPHFEMEDGTIKYGKLGWPEGPSKWHAEVGEKIGD